MGYAGAHEPLRVGGTVIVVSTARPGLSWGCGERAEEVSAPQLDCSLSSKLALAPVPIADQSSRRPVKVGD
jgi:hypothetical protein